MTVTVPSWADYPYRHHIPNGYGTPGRSRAYAIHVRSVVPEFPRARGIWIRLSHPGQADWTDTPIAAILSRTIICLRLSSGHVSGCLNPLPRRTESTVAVRVAARSVAVPSELPSRRAPIVVLCSRELPLRASEAPSDGPACQTGADWWYCPTVSSLPRRRIAIYATVGLNRKIGT